MVDGVSLPVAQGGELFKVWPVAILATIGVVAGTVLGTRIFTRIPETTFRRRLSRVGFRSSNALLSYRFRPLS